MRLAFHDDGSGTPILWIHGYPLSSAVFARQTEIPGVRHIRPDLAGFGTTPPSSGSMTMRRYAHDLVDLLDDLGIERAVVAGLSMGGYVAMQLLRDSPDRAAGLILLSTRETADSDEARQARYKSADDVAAHGIGSVVESMLPKMVVHEEYRDEVRRIMESSSPAGMIGALRAMAARPDSADVLRKLNVPALIVASDRDTITTVADAQRMQGLLDRAEVVIVKGAAHLANVECAKEVNDAVASFLREASIA